MTSGYDTLALLDEIESLRAERDAWRRAAEAELHKRGEDAEQMAEKLINILRARRETP